MTAYQTLQRISNAPGIIGNDLGSNNGQPPQEISTINEDCNFGHSVPEQKSSKGSALLMIANPVSRMEARRTAMERMTAR